MWEGEEECLGQVTKIEKGNAMTSQLFFPFRFWATLFDTRAFRSGERARQTPIEYVIDIHIQRVITQGAEDDTQWMT